MVYSLFLKSLVMFRRHKVWVLGITPWNYPLNQMAAKIFPAMLVGCTVVLKPSEVLRSYLRL